MDNRSAYLDNNATTRVDPRVVDAMVPWFSEHYGNPSSVHAFGSRVVDAVKTARIQVQELIGARFDHEIVFTSGGTESDNAAILSALETQAGRDEIVTSEVEHPAVLALCQHVEKARGVKVHYVSVDDRGRLDMDNYRRALSPRTAIVSLMWANNETGTIFPIAELAELAHNAGALFHTDAVQAAGKLAINVKETAIDMLSLSGHKIHGPKGIGALYVRKGVRLAPLLRGGRQERGRRAGTENVPAIVGFGTAAVLAGKALMCVEMVRKLRDRLQFGLVQRSAQVSVLGDIDHRLPNTLNVAFQDIESDAILLLLDKYGIAASSGSACASGSMEPSHVLRAMKVPFASIHGAVRFSFSRENTDDDVDHVLEAMPQILRKLRRPPVPAVAHDSARWPVETGVQF